MDHSVKAMTSSQRKVSFDRVFRLNRRRFENKELESLYQRYIFKHQQSSIICILVIMSLLSVCLVAMDLVFTFGLTLVSVFCLVQGTMCAILLVLSQSRRLQVTDSHLRTMCYLILLFCFLFALVSAPVDLGVRQSWLFRDSAWDRDRSASEGVWETVFVIFLVYALLPIQTRFSAAFGTALSLVHLMIAACFSVHFHHLLWNQVRTTSEHTFTHIVYNCSCPESRVPVSMPRVSSPVMLIWSLFS